MLKNKILDCTLRDGGYYTNWDFDKAIVDKYIKAIEVLPIDYVELGYRNKPASNYLGKYGYCPPFELERIKNNTSKKIAVMLNEKDVSPADLSLLLDPITGLVDMVRMAVDPKKFDRAVKLAESVKKCGFEVGFNVMYMSQWNEIDGFMDSLSSVNNIVDVFCMVDSYGGVSPMEVTNTLNSLKDKISCLIGFHGHNNLELSLANTLAAISNGVDFVDTTILGMGRGSGNLKTELLLTYLNKNYDLKVDFNVLGEVVYSFSELKKKYMWGTSLPYMIAGANSFPQKDVMEMTNNRRYSFNSIVRKINNKKNNVLDNAKFPLLPKNEFDNVIIIGGGENAAIHNDGVREFIKNNSCTALVHASAKNAIYYKDVNVPQYFCLIGDEANRISDVFPNKDFQEVCVLPPYPREFGTLVYDFLKEKTFELEKFEFTETFRNASTTVALQTAALLSKSKKYFIVGYDGYVGNIMSEKEIELTNENNLLFSQFKNFYNVPIISLTPSVYSELEAKSVYEYLQ
ncbi:MAG: aldolase catalytic domain-containing protein [Bacteroidales bacterium]|jgi:4-hydroxy 2-oxovalerate aldolase|nr:aldolase catalytic domain-containing protein [Bacteroidales bacterium]